LKKIAVVGLYDIKNVGDNILCDTTQFLIKKNLGKVDIIEVDVNPAKSTFKNISKLKFKIWVLLYFGSRILFSYKSASKFRYKYEYFMWWIKINKNLKKQLLNVDAIVFAGGGFLKFRTQGLNYYVEQIIKIAHKHNIPVMMNGVGIEGYDEKDIRCQKMKKVINMDCVKVITTRDDVEILQNNYIYNKNIRTSLVGDPALWINECYEVNKHQSDSKLIGINLIRGKIYQAYGNSLSEFDLLLFYKKLITGIEKRGWDWLLFSNGMKSDQAFGEKLLMALNIKNRQKLTNPKSDIKEYLELVASFKCVFGARLHACITAYALDVPVVGLIWNEKIEMFSKIIDKSQNFFTEENLDIEKILDTIEKSFEDKYSKENRDGLKDLTFKYLSEFLDLI